MRPTRFLLAVLALAAPWAGCLEGTPEPPAADGEGEWSGLDAPGAAVVVDGLQATVSWTGTFAPTDGTVRPDVRWLPPSTGIDLAAFALALPARVSVVDAALAWSSGDGFLGLMALDEEGIPQCGAQFRGLEVRCLATLLERRERTWEVHVVGEATARPPGPVDFTITLRLQDRDLPRFGPPVEGVGPTFADPVPMPSLGDEPSLTVTQAGTVYVAARTFLPEGLWSSRDGLSFGAVATGVPPYCTLGDIHLPVALPASPVPRQDDDSHTGCGDVDVAVAGEDTVFYYSHWGAEAVSVSHDGGGSWFHQAFGTGPQVPHTDRAWLTVEDADNAWLSYRDPLGTNKLGAAVARTVDGGLTWHTTVYWPEILDHCDPPVLVKGLDGMRYGPGCSEEGLGIFVSSDGGLTWTWRRIHADRPDIAAAMLPRAVGTVDAGGNLHLVWVQREEGFNGTSVWMTSSSDQARTWGEPVRITRAPGTYLMAWPTSGEAGQVAVAFYGTRAADAQPDYLLGDWYPLVAVTQDAAGGEWAIGSASPEPNHYGPICTSGARCVHARQLGDLFQVTAGPGGLLHVAFTDGLAGPTDNWRDLRVTGTPTYARQAGGPDVGARAQDRST